MVLAGYNCNKCGLKPRDVQVRDQGKDEDVFDYVHFVNEECCKHHRMLSPLCTPKSIDLLIPITAAGIGYPGRELTAEEKADLDRQCKK